MALVKQKKQPRKNWMKWKSRLRIARKNTIKSKKTKIKKVLRRINLNMKMREINLKPKNMK
jgi:hypothetical protein